MRQTRWLWIFLPLLLAAGCETPDLAGIRSDHAGAELAELQRRSAPVSGPLSLERAIEIALANNLDYALARFEGRIQEEAARGAWLALLPRGETDLQYEGMNRLRIASSEAADSGRTSLEPSFSTERDQKTHNFEVVFSLLDFGISYFRARQADNLVLVEEEQARRAAQNLVHDVTRTYYRALVAERAARESESLAHRLTERQKVVEEQMRQKLVNELEGFKNQEALVLVWTRIQEFQRELKDAKSELATLLGFAPGMDFEFASVPFETPPPAVSLDSVALEAEALRKRPELWEGDLQELIAADEIRARIASLFPNIEGFFGGHYDDNRFLRHQFWLAGGARVSWELFDLPRKLSDLDRAELGEDLVVQRRMALAMAIVAQVHVAAMGYEDALQQYQLARSLSELRERRLDASRHYLSQGQLDDWSVLQAESDATFARLRYLDAYAQVVISRQRVETAVGRGGPPRTVEVSSWAEANRVREGG
ncbi:MAG: TolC family protein [Planctomycetes bacterium]|nr:TolC family protein [Planctomycetota bacterium]